MKKLSSLLFASLLALSLLSPALAQRNRGDDSLRSYETEKEKSEKKTDLESYDSEKTRDEKKSDLKTYDNEKTRTEKKSDLKSYDAESPKEEREAEEAEAQGDDDDSPLRPI